MTRIHFASSLLVCLLIGLAQPLPLTADQSLDIDKQHGDKELNVVQALQKPDQQQTALANQLENNQNKQQYPKKAFGWNMGHGFGMEGLQDWTKEGFVKRGRANMGPFDFPFRMEHEQGLQDWRSFHGKKKRLDEEEEANIGAQVEH